MNRSHVLVYVGCFLTAHSAVGTLVTRGFAAFVTIVCQHGVPSAVTVIARWTMELAGTRVILDVAPLKEFSPTEVRVVWYKAELGTYKKQTIHHSDIRYVGSIIHIKI